MALNTRVCNVVMHVLGSMRWASSCSYMFLHAFFLGTLLATRWALSRFDQHGTAVSKAASDHYQFTSLPK
jgi:hypothetical protein